MENYSRSSPLSKHNNLTRSIVMSIIIYTREELKLLIQPFINIGKNRTDIREAKIPQELKEQIILSTQRM